MAENWYKVEVSLEDTASPGAPHAYGPVVLTFKTSGDDLVQAMSNAQKAMKEISKIPGTFEKIELA
jgi:hypothetical protein